MECEIRNNIVCHSSCKTCVAGSKCEEYACTSCFPDKFRECENITDKLFKCSENCSIVSTRLPDGSSFCEITKSTTLETTITPSTTQLPATKIKFSAENMGFLNVFMISLVIIFVIIFLTSMLILKFNRNRKRKALLAAHMLQEIKIPKSSEPFISSNAQYESLELIMDKRCFRKVERIGGGNYSTVFKGYLNDKLVAIKEAKENGKKSIYKEFQIYGKIISHPHIVPALAVYFGYTNIIFLELRKLNLYNFLKNHQDLKFPILRQFCIQLSDAVRFLHSKQILHCDIKIDNILMKNERGDEIEISDLGCAADLQHEQDAKHNGTLSHTAYELLKHIQDKGSRTSATEESDVWAFAVTSWQIFQKSAIVFPNNCCNPKYILSFWEEGKMLPKPAEAPEMFWHVIFFPCFDVDPAVRPSMEDLFNKLCQFS